MTSDLREALETIRKTSPTQTEMGIQFEKLTKIFLENDPTQKQQFSKVWKYSDWAKLNGYLAHDIGIDLVAKNATDEGFCAIQCKFYQADRPIRKKDIDSFVSASSSDIFTRLLLVDTSNQPLEKNSKAVLDKIAKVWNRIQTKELEDSLIKWQTFIREKRLAFRAKKISRDDQLTAIRNVTKGLSESDRGRLILPCGTGKTFTSLRIAEEIAGQGKLVLYMVPSLALMSQTIREWKNDSTNDFSAFSACSDKKVGRRNSSDDYVETDLTDLAFPATTDPQRLSEQIEQAECADPSKMTVVFSTYHSIDVISNAQKDFGLRRFDLIICDEAHRTTGVRLQGEDESSFIRIHSNSNVDGAKRLYMTATQRIYTDNAKKKVEGEDATLASMDDEEVYGKVLFHKTFGWAVDHELLTDYKVIVLVVDETIVSERVQKTLEGRGLTELKLDDATKMVGCYKALAKIGFKDKNGNSTNLSPMQRALAFCQSIKLSKAFTTQFMNVVTDYRSNKQIEDEFKTDMKVELEHVDGTFNADQRNERLNWLKEQTQTNICRILSNARCLAEGVDVPALDAVLFLHPRKSQIEVVQSVGRVMRKAKGKDIGYVILPITVAPGVSPERTLSDNRKYSVIWQILNALRAHDERLDSTINKIGLGEDVSDKIEIVGLNEQEKFEPTEVKIDEIRRKTKGRPPPDPDSEATKEDEDPQMSFTLTDISKAIKAKIVEKCGTRDYWENWATDIAHIAQQHKNRINGLLVNRGTPVWDAFHRFHEEIKDDLNPEITESEAIDMLAQHMITKPVFDVLFQGNKFTEENAVSKALQVTVDRLHMANVDSEANSGNLRKFYKSVEVRAEGIETAQGRQRLILELYDRFFRNAFPLLTQKLGIVYTPTEVVDFIIQSVEDVLKEELSKSMNDEGVHIIDPFAGTGTFITRLLQSGIISKENMPYKYQNEVHANEIVLLANYISCINIEATYHDIVGDETYVPFNGMVLTDTFQLYEQERDMIAKLMPDNSMKRSLQKKTKIQVIFGNPPYSVGQKDAGDNAKNITYPKLTERIKCTYAKHASAQNLNSLHDSYIRAFRWASDRLDSDGVIAFISGGGWLDKAFGEGVRKCFANEFSKIYVLHLRGDQRKNIALGTREEGDNIFGSASMTPITITLLVRNSQTSGECKILYKDIGDNLKKHEKLNWLEHYSSVGKIARISNWERITPNKRSEWINKGSESFFKFARIIDKSNKGLSGIFKNYSVGVKSNRDHWVVNFSPMKARKNAERLIKNFNGYLLEGTKLERISQNSHKVKWSGNLMDRYRRGIYLSSKQQETVTMLFRPFTKAIFVNNREIIERYYRNEKLFPDPDCSNLVIAISGPGSLSGFSVIMSDRLVNLSAVAAAQCFPLKLFAPQDRKSSELFEGRGTPRHIETDGLTNEGLRHFQNYYKRSEIRRDDLFFYIYGLLHSLEYRKLFANNLSKELPRIPTVKNFNDFLAFSKAGRKLGDLHVNYESIEPYQTDIKEGGLDVLSPSIDPVDFFRVSRMRFGGNRSFQDRSTVIYNNNITLENIPLEAYDYIVNGKPALKWVMEQQCVKTDSKSGITNDANDYANEVMKDPAYPLQLFQRVITVSLETLRIVRSLPKLNID